MQPHAQHLTRVALLWYKMADKGDRRSFSGGEFRNNSGMDDPPNSRLFIVCSKQLGEEDFRAAFSTYGEIEEIWVVKDRQTGERKGVTYIKYSKTSEAAAAMEAMNGRAIGNTNRHIKVMIAASRDQGSKRDGNEEERVQRLFVLVPKTMTDEELYDVFKQYGEIDYASVIRDKETRESKGFAYIRYYKFLHAALAYENCDKKFRAVFAEPRRGRQSEQSNDRYNNNSFDNSVLSRIPHLLPDHIGSSEGYTKLEVIASAMLNQDQLWKLFDIVPGLDYCQLRTDRRTGRGYATVVYTSHQWAAYAQEKLHGFEYPPGQRLIVKPEPEGQSSRSSSDRMPPISRGAAKPDLLQLAETIAQASSIIQAAGLTPDMLQSRLAGLSREPEQPLCNVKLPDPQPMADIDSEMAARCFIVCTPQPPPPQSLKDVFSRFGSLIDVYMLPNRNCGYAKYAQKESAANAITVLHGAEVSGVRLKVMEAEERNNDNRRKRLRLEDQLNPFT